MARDGASPRYSPGRPSVRPICAGGVCGGVENGLVIDHKLCQFGFLQCLQYLDERVPRSLVDHGAGLAGLSFHVCVLMLNITYSDGTAKT